MLCVVMINAVVLSIVAMLGVITLNAVVLSIVASFTQVDNLRKCLSVSNPLEICSDHFTRWLCLPVGINKDPAVWINGARLPHKCIFKNNTSLMNSKI